MARLFEIEEFTARKRALAAESEVYRQTMKLELQNFRLYSIFLKRRLNPLRRLEKVLPLAGAAAGFWFRRKQKQMQPKFLRTAMVGWQVYRTLYPLLRQITARLFNGRGKPREHQPSSS